MVTNPLRRRLTFLTEGKDQMWGRHKARRSRAKSIWYAGATALFASHLALAQTPATKPANQPPPANRAVAQPSPSNRPNAQNQNAPTRQRPLLDLLNLTPEQRQQIREIRRRNNRTGQLVTTRLRQAQRALDEAIYADQLDEREIEARIQELADAQAAVTRHRARVEMEIRRVLTPEQLRLFRQLREQERARQQQQRSTNQSPTTQKPSSTAPAPSNARP
ncbi:MAG: hypothetical protein C4334_01245 [Pyrinomonas sp.]|uniref:Spy/CpxP family protein refolding chaperone n=1 Tax=Pyrinomonas sp. TaxID=2080306 RepID=UPI0033263A7A